MAAILGYVAGTLPSSQMATKLAGRVDLDLTNDGTGNPGGMNTSHLLGKKWGVAVTVADAGKAAAAARIGLRLAGGRGANLAATSAVIGHCYPPKRRGGKGVATSLGQVAATFPVYPADRHGSGHLNSGLPLVSSTNPSRDRSGQCDVGELFIDLVAPKAPQSRWR